MGDRPGRHERVGMPNACICLCLMRIMITVSLYLYCEVTKLQDQQLTALRVSGSISHRYSDVASGKYQFGKFKRSAN